MFHWPPFALLFVLLTLASPAIAQGSGPLEALHQQDVRLARIADRILVANSQLCRRTMPVLGMIIHSQDQYGELTDLDFTDGPVAVSGIVPGSSAEQAGLLRGDAIRAIAGNTLDGLIPTGASPVRDAVFEMLAGQSPVAPVELVIQRDGEQMAIIVEPQEGCRALVEISTEKGMAARSDGRVIQLSYSMAEGLSDDGLATAFAHELAHAVLEHRRRLSEAGVSKGLLGEFGSNRRRNRAAEVEADRMSVHLLANAGLDPHIAPRFWLSEEARKVDAGILRSFIYPSPSRRAEIMEREIADHLPLGTGPTYPELLISLRDLGI